jgi:hypothetical protein
VRLSASSSLLTHLLQKSLARTTISSWTSRLRKRLQRQHKLWMGRAHNGVAHFVSILQGTTPIAKSTASNQTGMHHRMLHRMLQPEISRRIGAQRANWGWHTWYDQAKAHYLSLYPQDRQQIQSFAGLIRVRICSCPSHWQLKGEKVLQTRVR